MDIMEVMRARHSVRSYTDQKVETEIRAKLDSIVRECNAQSGMRIQIVYDEPACFSGAMARYGHFSGVKNYIALVGRKNIGEETAGYFGEKIVLSIQEMGMNSCWVALTHGKCAVSIDPGEKNYCVIAFGYGANRGVPHKNKPMERICADYAEGSEMYRKGVDAAMMAPTAVNQQKFRFAMKGGKVTVRAGAGFYAKLDLGIVKYHFEAATGMKI